MDLKLPEWASAPPTGFPGVVEPPTLKKQEGWDNGEEPAAGHFNWIFQAIADTQNEVGNAITGMGESLSTSNLSQLLATMQRQALKAAIGSLRTADDLGAGALRSITRAPSTGRIIAVGEAGLIAAGNGYNNFSTQAADASFAGNFQDIVFDSTLDLFVAVGDNAEIQTSPATVGSAWTERNSIGTNSLYAIDSDDAGHLIAVGGTNAVWTSSNGITWANRNPGFATSPAIVGVAYGVGAWVIVTNQGDIASSTDHGVTWTVRQALAGDGYGGPGARIGYDSFLGFIYHYATNIYQSNDGVTWTQIHNAVAASSSYPGLTVTPGCWSIVRDANGGVGVDGYYSPVTVNAVPNFRYAYATDAILSLNRLRLVDKQLMGVGGSKIYVGGVL